ncbi:MAG: hypothetical protein JNK14_21105 [Chitinophagaceae bacterium]|nr:hypothetical protein [Chitinophagaceae bacterium]
MRLSFLWIGILTLFASLFFLFLKWESYDVQSNGSIVDMEIIELPENCGFTKGGYFMDVKYKNEVFSKKIPSRFCNEHKPGELIRLRYLEGNKMVLFPEEKIYGDFVAIGIFSVVGIIAIALGIIEKRKRNF